MAAGAAASLAGCSTPTSTHRRRAASIEHVVVFVQENHTTDSYFRSMRAWGANVAGGWPLLPNPPAHDQPHSRTAYAAWLRAQEARHSGRAATRAQIDTLGVLPFYAYLAATGAFLENHCSAFGTNSTPNHLLIVGGQSPTLRNPPSTPRAVWDMPSVPGHAAAHGRTWKAYTERGGYPVSHYQELAGSPNIVRNDRIVTDAAAGDLPELALVWQDDGADEHPVADVTLGHDAVWRAVDAIAAAGLWDSTVFLLTWDDWGGFDDHVATPALEHTADGVQLAYGPRVPLLMFGGRVPAVIDRRWNSHVSIGRTVLDLLGLPPLGVPRLDTAPSLADLVAATPTVPVPPRLGTTIVQPAPPVPAPQPVPPPPPPTGGSVPVPPVVVRGGGSLPPPGDEPVHR
jgi:Phosphoesterase family